MVKKALCIGCNYPSKAFGLAGAVNDAFLIADGLQRCGFDSANVCVLHDIHPGQKKSMKVEPAKNPTRVNILQKLQWLVRDARAGDVLFFSFSGYGLQVDDMDGYQDEGYDEAILPTDFVEGRDGDYAVIVADDIHDILLGTPAGCSCVVLMDCDHATSVVDVSGTVDGSLVRGLKYQNYCGLKGHTTKVQLANHDCDVWREECARALKARPRFQPTMEVDNPKKGRLPTRPGMSRSLPVAFCYSAAGHGQTAMEMQMTTTADSKDQPKQHGILSWCFVLAMAELNFDCTYMELAEGIREQMRVIKERDLPRMDQDVLFTFSAPLSDPNKMRLFQPLPDEKPDLAPPPGAIERPPPPPIVPPPPRGFLQLGKGAGKGNGGTASGRTSSPAVQRPGESSYYGAQPGSSFSGPHGSAYSGMPYQGVSGAPGQGGTFPPGHGSAYPPGQHRGNSTQGNTFPGYIPPQPVKASDGGQRPLPQHPQPGSPRLSQGVESDVVAVFNNLVGQAGDFWSSLTGKSQGTQSR